MIERIIQSRIEENLKPNKVNLVFGARRVGKTVLLKTIEKNFSGRTLFLNGEDSDTQILLGNTSIANYRNLFQGIDLLILDEAQSVEEIGKKLKLIVDEVTGLRIIASGSSSFDLLNKTGEPLVGRSTNFYLFPFSQSELSKHENLLQTKQNLEERLLFGSYPELVLLKDINQKRDYLRDITGAYLLKDILSLDGVKNARKMSDLLKLIAFQTGNLVSYDELGKQLNLSRNTVEKYLDLLAKVFIIFRLSPYSKNLRKEITKSSKWYFYDNGIRNQLIGDFSNLSIRHDIGQLWENYLISERIKQNLYLNVHSESFFWRTYDGQEIDLIEKTDNSIQAFEFKWGNKIPRAPLAFSNNYPNAKFTVINQENYLNFINHPA